MHWVTNGTLSTCFAAARRCSFVITYDVSHAAARCWKSIGNSALYYSGRIEVEHPAEHELAREPRGDDARLVRREAGNAGRDRRHGLVQRGRAVKLPPEHGGGKVQGDGFGTR